MIWKAPPFLPFSGRVYKTLICLCKTYINLFKHLIEFSCGTIWAWRFFFFGFQITNFIFKESCRLIHAGWVLIFCGFSLAVFKGKRKTLNKRVTYNMQILLVIWDICRVWSIFYSVFNYYGVVNHESKPLLSATLRALFIGFSFFHPKFLILLVLFSDDWK